MRINPVFGFIGFLLIMAPAASAHRVDEYLQATRLSIAANQVIVELDLTPGIDVAPMIFASINTDHDGRISASEGDAYAKEVLKDIRLELDGNRSVLHLLQYQFPSFREMAAGLGTIRIQARAQWSGVAGKHFLVYQNDHKAALGVYLVNALRPATSDIEITDQQRDPLQHETRLGFMIR